MINTGFVFDIKYDALTKTEIVKSRLVAKWCGQKIGEDNSETYAPTVDPITIRMALAWAIQKRWLVRQLDIKAAFLIPPLPKNEIVYSRAPKGYATVEKWLGNKSFNEKTTLIVWVKSVYGLKQSMNLWHKYFGVILAKLGFIQQHDDPCLYIRKTKDNQIRTVLLYHVDDILAFCPNSKEEATVIKELSTVLPIKDIGKPERFLGVEFKYMKNGDVLLHQQSYTHELLKRYKWEHLTPSKSPTTPNRLSKEGKPLGKDVPYREAIGALLWLAIMTRPDIIFGVIELAQFSSAPTEEHWESVKLKFRYIKGTSQYGVWIKLTKNPSELRLWGASDADWGGAEDRSSMGGVLMFWNNTLIGWESKKIRCICLSSCESEIVTMSRAARTLKWARRMTKVLDGKYPECIDLLCDNQGAIDISKNGIKSRRTKHIEISGMYVQQAAQEGWLECIKVGTLDQPADALTKPMGPQKFEGVADVLRLR